MLSVATAKQRGLAPAQPTEGTHNAAFLQAVRVRARLVVARDVPAVSRGGTVFNTLNFSISPLDLGNQTGYGLRYRLISARKRFA